LLSDYATLAYIDSPNGIFLDLRSNLALDGFRSLDRIVGYFPQIKGSPYNDMIIADDEARWIFPEGGNDTVVGGKSGKTMIGVNSVADWSVQVVSDQAVLYTNKLNGDSIEVHNNHVLRDLFRKEIRTDTVGWSYLQSPSRLLKYFPGRVNELGFEAL